MITNDTIRSNGARSEIAEFKPGDTCGSLPGYRGQRERSELWPLSARRGEGIGETLQCAKNS